MRDALGHPQSVLVLGGGSDIGLAIARALVSHRARTVILAARRPDELETEVKELRAAGAETVDAIAFDADATESHPTFVDQVFDTYGDIDCAVLAWGVLGDQDVADHDQAHALRIARTNYLGVISVTVPLVERMRTQGHGTVVGISSIAGERVRAANCTYGSSKAAMDGYLLGLSDRLWGSGVRVMVVRPGFVHTKMTEGMKVAPLATTPEAVAAATVRGLEKGTEVVWVPPAIRYLMSTLRHLPRPVFRRLPIG